MLKKSLLIVGATLLLISGCVKDYIPELTESQGFNVQMKLASYSVVDTRSSTMPESYLRKLIFGESYMANGYVLVFDQNDPDAVVLSSYAIDHERDIKDNGTLTPQIMAPVKVATGNIVRFIFNLPLAVGKDIAGVTINNFDEYFPIYRPAGGIGVDPDAQGTFGYRPYEKGVRSYNGLPIYGEILSWSSTTTSVEIKRQVAKITVEIPAGGLGAENDVTGNFDYDREDLNTMNTFSLRNFTRGGGVLSNSHYVDEVFPYGQYFFGSDAIIHYEDHYIERESIPYDRYYHSIYLPSYNYSSSRIVHTEYVEPIPPVVEEWIDPASWHRDRLCIILNAYGEEGVPESRHRVYRLDFAHNRVGGEAPQFFDIEDNVHYKFRINKVSNFGHHNFGEAIINPGSNIDYEIVVGGGHSVGDNMLAVNVKSKFHTLVDYTGEIIKVLTDIPSDPDNGKEFEIYGKLENVEICDVNYTLTEGYVPPTYLTTRLTVESSNPQVRVISQNIHGGDLTAVPKTLKVTFMGKGSTVLTITAVVGNAINTSEVYLHLLDAGGLSATAFDAVVDGNIDGSISFDNDGVIIKSIADNKILFSLPEYSTPTSWKLRGRDGSFTTVADGSDMNAIPVFNKNNRVTDITATTTLGEVIKFRAEQSPPIYIGRFGTPEEGVQNANGENFPNSELTSDRKGQPLRKRAIITTSSSNANRGPRVSTPGNVGRNLTSGLSISTSGTPHLASKVEQQTLNRCYRGNNGYVMDGDVLEDSQVRWYLPTILQLTSTLFATNYSNFMDLYPFMYESRSFVNVVISATNAPRSSSGQSPTPTFKPYYNQTYLGGPFVEVNSGYGYIMCMMDL